ncbi:uncharacterized protein Z518_02847 [Rhinocladiella mackenziei CBS 650.93]|uniref:GP-PDE domain-containing protein n=1 Tax=Rhinocladiella mackenziei CBS 650.93 TaxID=1442369 RepID=A0A0D2IXT3_9EURO|nr:uncharacterized protein Z518_02847 [Rhinocladiella mackenziei CBS 650.93]KIX08191.1 hypothetical protein Z518_02847 [Rhinocladiella mackenziei CBS 650.93]
MVGIRVQTLISLLLVLGILPLTAIGARQPYDVRKVIQAFRQPHEDLVVLCAHRGLRALVLLFFLCNLNDDSTRWNGTTENSRDAYFRASEAGVECIETDIHISLDGYLPMIHDTGLGRETDVGEATGRAAYNPFTGKGYNPSVNNSTFKGFIEHLHLRDEGGRVHDETVPTLPQIVQSIYDSGTNVVLQLDFKDEEAVEPAYWQLKNLTNAAGVPANEWCIYKLQATWYRTPEEFEALPWVQDAFVSGIQLAFIPVYNPNDEVHFDTLASLQGFLKTNYTISAEIELYSPNGPLQALQDHVATLQPGGNSMFRTSGIFYAIGDFVTPTTARRTFFDTANYTLPADERVNNSVFVFRENRAPVLLDSIVGNMSTDGHDYRSNFDWILKTGFDWVITDTPDEWDVRLRGQGKRNIKHMLADGQKEADQALVSSWYKNKKRNSDRRHARDFEGTA